MTPIISNCYFYLNFGQCSGIADTSKEAMPKELVGFAFLMHFFHLSFKRSQSNMNLAYYCKSVYFFVLVKICLLPLEKPFKVSFINRHSISNIFCV